MLARTEKWTRAKIQPVIRNRRRSRLAKPGAIGTSGFDLRYRAPLYPPLSRVRNRGIFCRAINYLNCVDDARARQIGTPRRYVDSSLSEAGDKLPRKTRSPHPRVFVRVGLQDRPIGCGEKIASLHNNRKPPPSETCHLRGRFDAQQRNGYLYETQTRTERQRQREVE